MTFLSNLDIEPIINNTLIIPISLLDISGVALLHTVKNKGIASPIQKTCDILRMLSLFFDIDDDDIQSSEWQAQTIIEITFSNKDVINGSFIEMIHQSIPVFFYITRYTQLRFRFPPAQIRFLCKYPHFAQIDEVMSIISGQRR